MAVAVEGTRQVWLVCKSILRLDLVLRILALKFSVTPNAEFAWMFANAVTDAWQPTRQTKKSSSTLPARSRPPRQTCNADHQSNHAHATCNARDSVVIQRASTHDRGNRRRARR